MRIRAILSIIVLVWAVMAHASTSIIHATINGMPEGTVMEFYPVIFQNVKPLATGQLHNGSITLRCNVTETIGACLRVKGQFVRLLLIVQPGKTTNVKANATLCKESTKPFYVYQDITSPDSPLTSLYYAKLKTRDTVNAAFAHHYEKYDTLLKRASTARSKQDKTDYNAILASAEYRDMLTEETSLNHYAETTYTKLFRDNRDTFWGPLLMSTILGTFSSAQQNYYDILTSEGKRTYHARMLAKLL